MSYKRTIEIEGPHENAVESFIHELRKQADDGQRFGIDLTIRRVKNHETSESTEFKTGSEQQ